MSSNSDILTIIKYDIYTGIKLLFEEPYSDLFVSLSAKYIDIHKALIKENRKIVEERCVNSLVFYFSNNEVVNIDKIKPCYSGYSSYSYINYFIVIRDISDLYAKILYQKALALYNKENVS